MSGLAGYRSMAMQALTLAAFAALATGLIGVVERLTGERAAANRAADELKVLAEVLPEGYDNEPHIDVRYVRDSTLLGSRDALPVYFARRGDALLGMAVTVIAPDGYVAPIRLLVGIDTDGKIIAVRVLEHRETPGLGDRIEPERSDWLGGLTGKSLGDAAVSWRQRREGGEYDQLSGASVTGNAVLRAVNRALEFAATLPVEPVPDTAAGDAG